MDPLVQRCKLQLQTRPIFARASGGVDKKSDSDSELKGNTVTGQKH